MLDYVSYGLILVIAIFGYKEWPKYENWRTIVFILLVLIAFVVSFIQKHQQNISDELKSFKGTLVAASEATPSLPSSCVTHGISKIPDGSIGFFIGNSLAIANKFPYSLFTYKDSSLITINKTSQGEITLSIQVKDSQNKIIAEITDNILTVNQNNILSMDRPDKSTLIVRDQYGYQVLYFKYLNPKAIKFLGKLYYDLDKNITIEQDIQKIGPSFSGTCIVNKGIKINADGTVEF